MYIHTCARSRVPVVPTDRIGTVRVEYVRWACGGLGAIGKQATHVPGIEIPVPSSPFQSLS